MENQKEVKSTHEIIYVERIGGTKKIMKRICNFDTAEEAEQCIKKLKLIESRQKIMKKRTSKIKQWHEKDIIKLQKVFQKTEDDLAFQMILNADIRAGELCALKWADVDFENRTVNISKTISNFNNNQSDNKLLREPRKIKLSGDIVNRLFLHKMQQVSSTNDDYILNAEKILKPEQLSLRLKRLLTEVGIEEEITLQNLRQMYKQLLRKEESEK